MEKMFDQFNAEINVMQEQIDSKEEGISLRISNIKDQFINLFFWGIQVK